MGDDRDDQRNSFHWPPTAEELESIQVIEVHDDVAGAPPARDAQSPWRAWWHRMMQEAVIAQVGLAAASFAAIGIAVTSLLAPAQPTARAAKRDVAPAPLVASSTVPAAAATAPAFEHKVTFEPPPPALEQVRAERQAQTSAARVSGGREELTPSEELAAAREERAAAREERASPAPVNAVHTAPPGQKSLTIEKPRARTRPTPTQKRDAGSDPVSRLATRTGLSVWKAMRAVGRSLKPDNVVATR